MEKFRSILAIAALVAVASVAQLGAQAPAAGSVNQAFAWDQAAPTLADAQAYTFRFYADGSTTASTFAGVSCSGATSPYLCSVAIPAFTPGSHTVTITAGNVAGESPKSSPFAFVFVVTPAAPLGIRIR